ncbi:MAG TPA: anaerobic ribonucleoside-triphosphate reductase, partial [Candidatus Hydrogenedens sp.]|nr:anaerobic ribonucleoside-triphosphate reductase [Candidatus Hydrogenedens sp.]
TPAEGTCYRLARLDYERYPDAHFANTEHIKQGSVPFYTNSTQLPVDYTDDIFKVLDLQDPLQTKYTGGTVLHIFLGESVVNPNSVKSFVKKVCEGYKLPYFTLTPSFTVCPQDGYIRGEFPTCPKCGNKTEVYSRVVGYLRPVSQWNEGKQAEFQLRARYKID